MVLLVRADLDVVGGGGGDPARWIPAQRVEAGLMKRTDRRAFSSCA